MCSLVLIFGVYINTCMILTMEDVSSNVILYKSHHCSVFMTGSSHRPIIKIPQKTCKETIDEIQLREYEKFQEGMY